MHCGGRSAICLDSCQVTFDSRTRHYLGVVPSRNFLSVGQHVPKLEIIVISTMGPIKCFRHILVLLVFVSLAGGRFQISNLPSEKAGIAGSLDRRVVRRPAIAK
jgi:hypothetical protein